MLTNNRELNQWTWAFSFCLRLSYLKLLNLSLCWAFATVGPQLRDFLTTSQSFKYYQVKENYLFWRLCWVPRRFWTRPSIPRSWNKLNKNIPHHIQSTYLISHLSSTGPNKVHDAADHKEDNGERRRRLLLPRGEPVWEDFEACLGATEAIDTTP